LFGGEKPHSQHSPRPVKNNAVTAEEAEANKGVVVELTAVPAK